VNRKLSVKKERLTELTSDELVSVAGGAPDSIVCSLLAHCGSVNICSTMPSCGCPITYQCNSDTCA